MIPLLAALLLPTAEAGNKPYMWGVGPTINTIAVPGRFPLGFPSETDGTLTKTKNDLGVGAHGVLYLEGGKRIGAHLTAGFGENFNSLALTAEYEAKIVGSDGFVLYSGIGGGFGNLSFDAESGTETLRSPTYIVRGNVGAYYRDGTRCYEISPFAQIVIPGRQEFTNAAGNTEEISSGFTILGGYSHIGIEATVYFGDFKPPKKNKSSNSSKKSSGSSKGGNRNNTR